MQKILEIRKVSKSFQLQRNVLRNVSLSVSAGELVVLMGPSGSGKSTLINIASTVDRPDAGEVIYLGSQIHDLDERKLAAFRNRSVGIVFQSYHLLQNLKAWENVAAPMFVSENTRDIRARAQQLLDKVGLKGKYDSLPSQLSGGEKQRVAIARAVANNPKLIVADEPTGSLDSYTGSKVIDLFEQLKKDSDIGLLIATHDVNVASRADRVLHLIDGQLSHDI